MCTLKVITLCLPFVNVLKGYIFIDTTVTDHMVEVVVAQAQQMDTHVLVKALLVIKTPHFKKN